MKKNLFERAGSAQIVRWIVLSAILAGTMLINYLHLHGGTQFPSVHAFCPLGGLENLWAWVGGKSNLQKLFSGTMTLFFFTAGFALIFGRAFCGVLCPFGFLQELFGKLSPKKLTIPPAADKYLRYLKYILLVFITAMAWITATIWISPYDPYTAFAHIWAGAELLAENGAGFVILSIVLLASIFIDRFFCKYLCPAGALYGILGKVSPFKIRRTACIGCTGCSKRCPMNIEVDKTEKVTSAECIMCGKCIQVCPQRSENVLSFSFGGKKIRPLGFILLSVLLFFSGLGALNAAGLLRLTVPSAQEVQTSGKYLKIDDLRGSMTIEQGAFYTGMPLEEFYRVMEIPQTIAPDTQMKNISLFVPGYDFHVIKAKK